MRITVLGSGDAFGTGGRFNTCILAEHAKGAFLIDCGASSLVAIRKFGVDPNRIDQIFVSHLHGDHFGGVPFFLLDAQFYSRRTNPLLLVGPPGFEQRLTQAMEVFYPGSSKTEPKFAQSFIEIDPGRQYVFDGVSVEPFLVAHECGAPPFALRFCCEGKIVTYSGDTEWTDNLVDAAGGADLFLAECLSFERPIKFHMNFRTLMANKERLSAKRILLTHMGPDMLKRSLKDVGFAHDGLSVEV
jgi:ribonuclease BN (tRNA processing enzyme)